jgi:acetolactate synthase-1/2/3 large subunit
VVVGDGASRVRLGLDLVVLILQDNAYGMIRWKQAADGYPDFGMTFADGLAPALEAGFAGGGVHLISVPVDYSENMRVLPG